MNICGLYFAHILVSLSSFALLLEICKLPTTFCIAKCYVAFLLQGAQTGDIICGLLLSTSGSEKTVTAPCRRPKGRRFLNTEPGARAQSYTSCSTDTLLWGASSSTTVCASMHDWRLDWDMFAAVFARRRSRFLCAFAQWIADTLLCLLLIMLSSLLPISINISGSLLVYSISRISQLVFTAITIWVWYTYIY